MIPTKKQYKKYFSGNMSEQQFRTLLNKRNFMLEKSLENKLKRAKAKKDGEMLAYLIHTIFLLEEKIALCKYVMLFNELLVQEWHKEHENLAMLLEQVHSDTSISYLKRAIDMNLEYLAWDDNFAFQVKCIWALSCIDSKDVQEVLMELTKSPNKVISENAEKRVREWELSFSKR